MSNNNQNLDSRKKMVTKPLKFTVEELKKVIEDYFANTPFNEWTVTGLALCVGSKQLLIDYQNRPDYSTLVREAKLKVENSYEMSLRTQGGAHNIFALKNFGWKDKREIESSGIDGNPIEHKHEVVVVRPSFDKNESN